MLRGFAAAAEVVVPPIERAAPGRDPDVEEVRTLARHARVQRAVIMGFHGVSRAAGLVITDASRLPNHTSMARYPCGAGVVTVRTIDR